MENTIITPSNSPAHVGAQEQATNGKSKRQRSNEPFVFEDRESALASHGRRQKEKTGKIDYNCYQVDLNGKTLFAVGISPADAFGKCGEKFGAKVTLLTHKAPTMTVETMMASFSKLDEDQKQQIISQLMKDKPVEVKIEEKKPSKGKAK